MSMTMRGNFDLLIVREVYLSAYSDTANANVITKIYIWMPSLLIKGSQ